MKIDFSKLDGLIPAVIQDANTLEILMVGFMNEEALAKTKESGFATFWSRTRNKLWMKGETSGNQLKVVETLVDCDEDTLVYEVDPEGPSCHTGAASCFFRDEAGDAAARGPLLVRLEEVLCARKDATAEKSYTKSLYDGGPGRIAQKVREEADELGRALEGEADDRVVSEAADVLFHAMVGLVARGLSVRDVLAELDRRFGTGGHAEKAQRRV